VRSPAENLAARLAPAARNAAELAAIRQQMAQALYPGLTAGSAEATWQDTFQVFNETSKAAGLGAATGGPVGAVIGGLASLITGVIEATAKRKIRKQEAVRWAHALGIEDAKDFPAFLVDLQAMGLRERVDLVHELNKKAERVRPGGKRHRKLEQRKDAALVLIGLDAVATQRMRDAASAVAAQARQEAGRAESARALAARQARAVRSTSRWLLVAAAISGLSLAAVAAR